jgi:hypothetical protein
VSALGEALALSPDVLMEQHGAKLLQTGRGIVERSEDRFALRDVEAEERDLVGEGGAELLSEVAVVDRAGELEDEFASDGDAGEEHAVHHRTDPASPAATKRFDRESLGSA